MLTASATISLSICLLLQASQTHRPVWPIERFVDERWADGEVDWVTGRDNPVAFGYSLCALGDVDGDGAMDLAVGAPLFSTDAANGRFRGCVHFFSSRTREELLRVVGDEEKGQLGRTLATLADFDGDGTVDLFLGGQQHMDPRVVSGRTGTELFQVDNYSHVYGGSGGVCSIADVDGDDMDDFVVGNPNASSMGRDRGSIAVCSGRDGSLLGRVFGARAGDMLGFAVRSGIDVNADGVPDILATAPRGNVPNRGFTGYPPAVLALSGKDGSVLYEVEIEYSEMCFGVSLELLPDLDDDDVDDYAVGAPYNEIGDLHADFRPPARFGGGSVVLLSGRDGTVLRRLSGSDLAPDLYGVGYSMAVAADADDRTTLAVGAYSFSLGGQVLGVRLPTGKRSWARGGVELASSGRPMVCGLGGHIASLGDVDGDGHGDFACAAVSRILATNIQGQVLVLSGRDGSVLAQIHPPGG